MAQPSATDEPRSLTILVFAAVGFAALVISGLGVVSLLLDAPIIAERGMTQLPGIFGTVFAILGFAAVAYPALRRRASVGMAVLAGIVAAAGYAVGVAVGAVVAGADPFRALSVAGDVAVSWPMIVIVVAGLVSAALALVVVRSGPGAARWPWERTDDSE